MRLKHLIVTAQYSVRVNIVDIVTWKALKPGACLHGSQGEIWLATPGAPPPLQMSCDRLVLFNL